MKAILIPANISDPVKEIDFDPDRSWRYVVTRYDPGAPSLATDVAILTKENAPRDYLVRNSRASEYVQSKLAANDQTDGLGSPENLYGDVVVLGYDKPFEMLTDVPAGVDPDDFDPSALGPESSVSPDLDDFEPGDSVRTPDLDPEPKVGLWPYPLSDAEDQALTAEIEERQRRRSRGIDPPGIGGISR